MRSFSIFSLSLLFLFSLCFAELTPEEKESLKKQVPSSTATHKDIWLVLQNIRSAPKFQELSVEGQNLTVLFIYGLDFGLEFSLKSSKFQDFGPALMPDTTSPVTVIQYKYITEMTYEEKKDTVSGIIRFECKNYYQGKIGYKAIKKGKEWKIVEYTLLNRGSTILLEDASLFKTEEGEDLFFLEGKKDLWILQEHFIYYSSPIGKCILHRWDQAPVDVGTPLEDSQLETFLKEKSSKKVMFSLQEKGIPLNKLRFLFTVWDKAGKSFPKHLDLNVYSKNEITFLKTLYENYLQKTKREEPTYWIEFEESPESGLQFQEEHLPLGRQIDKKSFSSPEFAQFCKQAKGKAKKNPIGVAPNEEALFSSLFLLFESLSQNGVEVNAFQF